MRRLITLVVFFCTAYSVCQAQNTNINQNQNNIVIQNNVQPVIEKRVYIERYRPVYVQVKRTARKLDAPVMLHGFLCVYPEDLGNFKQHPNSLISSINNQHMYGHSDWRIPTPDELAVLEQNAETVGLGDDIYMATDHANGVLRLVATISNTQTNYPVTNAGSVYWMNDDYRTSRKRNRSISEAECPYGYRLPTTSEFEDLLEYSNIKIIVDPSGTSASYNKWYIVCGGLSIELFSSVNRMGNWGYDYFFAKDGNQVHGVKLIAKVSWPENVTPGQTLTTTIKGSGMRVEECNIDEGRIRCIKAW